MPVGVPVRQPPLRPGLLSPPLLLGVIKTQTGSYTLGFVLLSILSRIEHGRPNDSN